MQRQEPFLDLFLVFGYADRSLLASCSGEVPYWICYMILASGSSLGL